MWWIPKNSLFGLGPFSIICGFSHIADKQILQAIGTSYNQWPCFKKNYLDDQINVLTTDLEKHGENVALWKKLAETTLTKIVLFNKRRSSEVSKLLLNSFMNLKNWEETVNDEIASGRKPIEKVLLKRYEF